MSITNQLSKAIYTFHYGGNWTEVNLKELLSDVTVDEANKQFGKLNTIVRLTYHINYFMEIIIKVLKGSPLVGNDKFSFDHPDVETSQEWQDMINRSLNNATLFSELVQNLKEEKLGEIFGDKKYGTYYQNIQGFIEHSYYHLGQISLIKKLLRS